MYVEKYNVLEVYGNLQIFAHTNNIFQQCLNEGGIFHNVCLNYIFFERSMGNLNQDTLNLFDHPFSYLDI